MEKYPKVYDNQRYPLELTRAELEALQHALVKATGAVEELEEDEEEQEGDAQHWANIAGRCETLLGRINQTDQQKLDELFLSDRAPR